MVLTKSRQQLQQIRKARTVLVKVAAYAASKAGINFEPIKGGYHVSQIPLFYLSCNKIPGRYEKLSRIDCAGGIVLRTKQNPEILLLLKNEGDQFDWVLPKGRRKNGESRQETAIREVQEETGLTALKIKKFLGREGYFIVSGKNVIYKRISYYLMYSLDPNVSLNVQKGEGFVDGTWVEMPEALSLTNPTRAHNILNLLRAELGKEKITSK